VSRAKRLGKLEQAAAEKVRARDLAVSIRWTTPDGGAAEILPSSARPPVMTLLLTRSDPPVRAPGWLDADAPLASIERPARRGQRRLDSDTAPEPKPVRRRGQRPPPPTEQEMEAARAELTRRWANGTWVGAPEMVDTGGDHGIPIRSRSARPAPPNANFDPLRLLR
jgi:hypothetical protein